MIDRLLASERYGERWGRHWLDLARYADSEGILDADHVRTHAWRYRDYVIRAFNKDTPYDRFLKAQIAGQDNGSKWRSFLARWEEEFPQIGSACKQALPTLERAYLGLVRELTERVNATEAAELDDEFVLGEFLDRFGIRLGQLGNILSQLAPLADAAPTPVENG